HGGTETRRRIGWSPNHPIHYRPGAFQESDTHPACRALRDLRRIPLRPLPAAHKLTTLRRQLSRLHARTRRRHAEKTALLLSPEHKNAGAFPGIDFKLRPDRLRRSTLLLQEPE